ncbi:Arginyl-tRNA synthetase, partial [Candidatus Omnitrophus magneticus]
ERSLRYVTILLGSNASPAACTTKDVARFIFLMRRLASHLDFAIEVANKESNDNPGYYIPFAHARLCTSPRGEK